MITYHDVPRGFVQVAYQDGAFGPRSELADQHIAQSDMFVAVVGPCTEPREQRLLGVFGAKALGDRTYVWFSETPTLLRHRVGFLRGVHRVRDLLLARYPHLIGLCYDPRSAAWLRWIGAEFTDDNSFSFRRA